MEVCIKRYLSIVLVLLMVIGMPISAYAKPSGGGETFNSTISFTPAAPVIDVGQSVTLVANWTTSLAVNRTQWSVDGVGQSVLSMKTAVTSGSSSMVYTGQIQGVHTITFRVWNNKFVGKRDASKSLTVTVNAVSPPEEVVYVSLGDSIATGTTTPLTSPTYPYPDQFRDYLDEINPGANIIRYDFETDGDQTSDLFGKLQTNTSIRNAVIAADVITVSIGGNNLMAACKTWLGLYDFFNPDRSELETGYAEFVAQWGAIMSEIRSLNDTAAIITMTLYNPYNTSDTTMHQLTDSYYFNSLGTGMNDLITGLASTYQYEVADAFLAFDAYSTGNMIQVNLLYPDSFTRNPHPNQTGQNMLFDLHQEIYDVLP